MTIALRSLSTIAEANASAICYKPSGTVDGDVLIALVMARSSLETPNITTPSGWTEIATWGLSNLRLSAYWKRAASEGDSYQFSHDTPSGNREQITVLCYSGVSSTGSPIDVYSNVYYTVSNNVLYAGGATPTGQPTMLVFLGQVFTNVTITPPTGFTERSDFYSATSLYTQYVADQPYDSLSAIGS